MNTAKFDRLKVLKACEDYAIFRDKYIEEEKEKTITKIMNLERKFLWLKLEKLTREQILYNLRHDSRVDYYFEFYALENGYTWKDEYKNILELIQLCKLSTDYQVTIDSVTAKILSRFL